MWYLSNILLACTCLSFISRNGHSFYLAIVLSYLFGHDLADFKTSDPLSVVMHSFCLFPCIWDVFPRSSLFLFIMSEIHRRRRSRLSIPVRLCPLVGLLGLSDGVQRAALWSSFALGSFRTPDPTIPHQPAWVPPWV